MNKYEEKVFEMYKKINIGKSDICQKCRGQNTNLSLPVSIWQVGDEYYDSKYRVLFVGKVARGTPGEKHGDFMDSTKRADELYQNVGWAYWNYTKAIANSLYDKNAWEKIAFTNMVKCNSSNTIDTTTDSMRDFCLLVLKEEIKMLKPKNIVFYTKGYDEQIERLFDNIGNSKTEYVNIGKKEMSSWTFEGTIGDNVVRCIRVGHPERLKKEAFVNHILQYLICEHP